MERLAYRGRSQTVTSKIYALPVHRYTVKLDFPGIHGGKSHEFAQIGAKTCLRPTLVFYLQLLHLSDLAVQVSTILEERIP